MTYTLERTNKAGEPRFTGYYLLPEKKLCPKTGSLINHYVSAGTAPTETEALKLADAKQELIDAGSKPDPELRATITVKQFLSIFLRKHAVGASTRDGYRRHLTKFVVPSHGSTKILDLERAPLQALLDRLGNPEKPKKPVPPATLTATRAALTAMIGYAMRLGYVSENCAKGLKVPTVVRKPSRAWAPDVWNLFRKSLPTDGALVFGNLQVVTGARISEICALRVSDFGNEGTLAITKAIVTANSQTSGVTHLTNDRTKNGTERVIELSVATRRMLNEWIETNGLGPDDLLFPKSLVMLRGGVGPMTPEAWSGLFKRAFVASGLAIYLRIPAKNVRHTHAVELLRRGTPPAVVAARLGHTKEILLTHYAVLALSALPADTSALDAALAAFDI